jgi:diguanylate cyclase (GGDEF)-like protein/PAS domain S-box-containing protein
MFERHNAIMLLTDPESDLIVDANPAAAYFYGYPLESLRGMELSRINTHSEVEINNGIQSKTTQQQHHFILEQHLANNDTRVVEVYSSPVYFENKKLLFSIIHDITERRLVEEKVRNLAYYDPLTKLPNRRLLYSRLEHSLQTSKKTRQYSALIFLDLDNFKPLNDTHGHKVGDLLLIEVALRLTASIRESDTAARFGGDEFVVLLSELDTERSNSSQYASLVAEKIRTALSLPYLLTVSDDDSNGLITVKHHCTASLGIVIFNHTDQREEILRHADIAMYEAKESGRNCLELKTHVNSKEGNTEH